MADTRLTFGADIGAAAVREANRSGNTTSGVFYGIAFAADVGAVVTPSTAITLRMFAIRGGEGPPEGDFFHVTTTFVGPCVEVRPAPRLQVSAGLGIGFFDDPHRAGYGADLRIGYSVWQAQQNELQLAIESAPTLVPETEARDSRDVVNVALLIAYRRR